MKLNEKSYNGYNGILKDLGVKFTGRVRLVIKGYHHINKKGNYIFDTTKKTTHLLFKVERGGNFDITTGVREDDYVYYKSRVSVCGRIGVDYIALPTEWLYFSFFQVYIINMQNNNFLLINLNKRILNV